METGDKNRDDFHCLQMSHKMIRRSSVFSTMTEVTHQVDHVLAVLAMMYFSPNRGPSFSCNYTRAPHIHTYKYPSNNFLYL